MPIFLVYCHPLANLSMTPSGEKVVYLCFSSLGLCVCVCVKFRLNRKHSHTIFIPFLTTRGVKYAAQVIPPSSTRTLVPVQPIIQPQITLY